MGDGESEPTLQPERVRSSRAPALAVLVIGIGILVVLVGVLPRLTGQPAAVDNIPIAPAATPAPPPSPAATPAPVIADCGPLFRTGPSVLDKTGFIDRCEVWLADDGYEGFFVTNPHGQTRILEVHWSAGACDLGTTFTFSSVQDRFQLVGRPPTTACAKPVTQHAVRLFLKRPVLAASVSADFPTGQSQARNTLSED